MHDATTLKGRVKVVRKLVLTAVAASCLAGLARAADAPASPDIIATRQAGQALVGGTFIGLLQAVKQNATDVKPFANAALAIAKWEPQFRTMFPPGTEHGENTRALPAIWSDRDGFNKASEKLAEEATKLSTIAKSGDREAFAAQVKVLGDACSACHKQFRAR